MSSIGAVGKNLTHPLREVGPLVDALIVIRGARSVKIVDHEEAAAQQKLAQLSGIVVAQTPVPDFHGVKHRKVEHVVGAVEADHLFDRAGIDARKPPHALEQMPVGARIIHRPVAGKRAAVAHRQFLV